MSLDKAIEHGKEKRKPYRGAKAVDHSCRNHGDCPWCQGAIKYKNKKRSGVEMQSNELDYGCDLCGVRHPFNSLIWITSSCGVCHSCHESLTKEDVEKLEIEFE